MITGILQFLAAGWQIFTAINNVIKEGFRKALEYQAIMWGFIIALVKWLYELISNLISTTLNSLELVHDNMTGATVNGALEHFLDILAFCNSFSPISELLGYAVILGLAMSAGLAYRFVKSWIPTVS
jgi:hypothetical protein